MDSSGETRCCNIKIECIGGGSRLRELGALRNRGADAQQARPHRRKAEVDLRSRHEVDRRQRPAIIIYILQMRRISASLGKICFS